MNDFYLGFIVKKPVLNEKKQNIIGKTVLIPKTELLENKSDNKMKYINNSLIDIHLCGFGLKIKTMPFQMQDMAVGACASTSIWASSFPLCSLFGIPPLKSLSEITKTVTQIPHIGRTNPSEGLNLYQMITYFKQNGLDVEIYNIKENSEIELAIKPYIDSNIPVIAQLGLKKNSVDEEYIFHAVVISGYKLNEEGTKIAELYIHDDGIGPYSQVICNNNFYSWDNEWKTWYGYDIVDFKRILIPIYPKIRLTIGKVIQTCEDVIEPHIHDGSHFSVSLQSVNEFKRELINENFQCFKLPPYKEIKIDRDKIYSSELNKEEVLKMNLPRYLWIFRRFIGEKRNRDWVYDSTSVYPYQILGIIYKNK